MKDNSDRSTIDILQEMAGVIRQLIVLDTLEQLLQTAKDDDDALKFLPLVKSMANSAFPQISTSERSKELNNSILSLIAILEQKQRELSSQSDRHDR